MSWNIADAKQRFSALVKQAVAEPQLIYNRKHLVAAVIDAEDYQAFKVWSEQRAARSLADEMAELRELMAQEDTELTVPPRTSRPNLEVTTPIARRAGELRGVLAARGSVRQQADMLIAATAAAHQLTLVTRNTKDFEQCGIGLLNPFGEPPLIPV